MIILKKELKLISTYVFLAYLCTWLSSSCITSITTFTLFRWLAEASLLPQTLLIVAFDPSSKVCDVAECYFFLYVPTIIVKVPLFVLMRCAEMRSDFFLNEIEIFVFKACYTIRQIWAAVSEQHSIQIDVFWCYSWMSEVAKKQPLNTLFSIQFIELSISLFKGLVRSCQCIRFFEQSSLIDTASPRQFTETLINNSGSSRFSAKWREDKVHSIGETNIQSRLEVIDNGRQDGHRLQTASFLRSLHG